jgi:hypothetical protein
MHSRVGLGVGRPPSYFAAALASHPVANALTSFIALSRR